MSSVEELRSVTLPAVDALNKLTAFGPMSVIGPSAAALSTFAWIEPLGVSVIDPPPADKVAFAELQGPLSTSEPAFVTAALPRALR